MTQDELDPHVHFKTGVVNGLNYSSVCFNVCVYLELIFIYMGIVECVRQACFCACECAWTNVFLISPNTSRGPA